MVKRTASVARLGLFFRSRYKASCFRSPGPREPECVGRHPVSPDLLLDAASDSVHPSPDVLAMRPGRVRRSPFGRLPTPAVSQMNLERAPLIATDGFNFCKNFDTGAAGRGFSSGGVRNGSSADGPSGFVFRRDITEHPDLLITDVPASITP
jgi:hypothetical protein